MSGERRITNWTRAAMYRDSLDFKCLVSWPPRGQLNVRRLTHDCAHETGGGMSDLCDLMLLLPSVALPASGPPRHHQSRALRAIRNQPPERMKTRGEDVLER